MKSKRRLENSPGSQSPETLRQQVSSKNPGYKIEFVHGGTCFLEGDQPIRAAVGFVSHGDAQSAVYEAMSIFEKIKFPAASFYVNSLVPFPVKALEAFAEKVEKIVIVESDSTAALSKMVREKTWIHPVVMVPPQGRAVSAREIYEKEDWN